jgi:hypothetical protein
MNLSENGRIKTENIQLTSKLETMETQTAEFVQNIERIP